MVNLAMAMGAYPTSAAVVVVVVMVWGLGFRHQAGSSVVYGGNLERLLQ